MAELSASAVLVDFSISLWSGRRQAKDEAADVTTKAKAVKDAASVSKNLMVGTAELGAVQAAAGELRRFVLYYTLPWSDSGVRLLPMSQFNTFLEGLDDRIQKFNAATDALILVYPTLVSAQAFKLGSMFNRADYPTPLSLKRKFKIHVRMFPVPEAGHFVVEAHNETVEKLKERAQKDKEEALGLAAFAAWERLYDALKKLEGLTDSKRVHESSLKGLGEVTALLTAFNVGGDPKLEEARLDLEKLLSGIKLDEFRGSEVLKNEVRGKTQEILSKFDFGVVEDEEESGS